MTLPTSTRVTDPYETDGVQRDFEFDFPAFYNADTGHYGIEVRRLTALDYEVIDKSLYDIFLNDEDKSGYVRFHVAPMAGDDIYIAGDTTRSQQLNLINYGRYSAQSIEKAFDLIVALIQEFVSKVDEETRQRILSDQALRDFLLIKFNQFTAEVTTKIDKHIGDINGFMSSLIPMFVCIMRKEIANYAETGMQDVIDEKLSGLSTQVANAIAENDAALIRLNESILKIDAAITATAIGARLFDTAAAGVHPVTGVPVGSYFNVRSPNADSYVDEYRNVGGVPTPSGKSYPSGSALNAVKEAIIDPVTGKATASKVFDENGKSIEDVNRLLKRGKLIDTRLYGLVVNTPADQTAAIHAAFAANPDSQQFYIPKGTIKANVVFPRAYMYLVGDGLLNTIIEPFDLTKSPVNFNKKLYAGLTDLTVQASQQFTGESLVNAQEVRYMHLENFDVRKTKLTEENHSYQTILIDNRAISGSWTGYNRLHNVRAVFGAYGYLADVDKLNSVLSIKDSLFSFNGYFNIKTSVSNSTIINCDIANGGKLQPVGVYDETQYGGAYIKGDNSVILGVWHELNAQASPSYNSNNLYIHPDSWNITHNFARDTRGTNNVRVYTQSQGQLQDVNTADRSLNDGQGRARPQQLIKNGNFAHWDATTNRPKAWSGYFSGTWTQETTDLPKGYNTGLKVVSNVAGVVGIFQYIYNPADLANSYIKDISKWVGREISVSFWVKNIGASESSIRGGISTDAANVYFSSGNYTTATKVGAWTKLISSRKIIGDEARISAGVRVSGAGEGMIVTGFSVADDCRVDDAQPKPITEDGGEIFGGLEVRGPLTNNGVPPLFQPAAVTTTGLTNSSGPINTVGKFAGKQVFNNTNSLMYYATGTTPTSPWKSFDSTSTITPV